MPVFGWMISTFILTTALTSVVWTLPNRFFEVMRHHGSTGAPEILPAEFKSGYIHRPGLGYYKFYDIAADWGSAWKQCYEDNAHLVVINSEEEKHLVRKLATNTKKYYVFIGIHDLFKHNHFVTILGNEIGESRINKFDPYKKLHNSGLEHCVAINREGNYSPIKCSHHYPFICEKEE